VSLFGRLPSDWDVLAKWLVEHDLQTESVIYTVEIPQMYHMYKRTGTIESFQDHLNNIFKPLFEVTDNPKSHPDLAKILPKITTICSVSMHGHHNQLNVSIMPQDYNYDTNPRFGYYMYYLYANLASLNTFRTRKGLSTINLCSDIGNTGTYENVAGAYLVADSIIDGNDLDKFPLLQYLYYLKQIGVVMSPLAANSYNASYAENAFPKFFTRGLKTSLGTDKPLQYHLTTDALAEEYAIAAQMWKLSHCDLSEVARNSVLCSGFPDEKKQACLGQMYKLSGAQGNDATKTNVPSIRLKFREDTLQAEFEMLALANQSEAKSDK